MSNGQFAVTQGILAKSWAQEKYEDMTDKQRNNIYMSALSKEIKQNSDGHLGALLNIAKQLQNNDYHYIEQINIDGLNTIDHKSPYRNYVGLDYEKIDIPGIHGQEI